MNTSPKDPLLPAVHDDNLMISLQTIKDCLETASYFSLHFALHIKLENLLQSIWENRSVTLIYQSLC